MREARFLLSLLMATVLAIVFASNTRAQDLGAKYPATLEYKSKKAPYYTWETGPEHIYALKKFSVDYGKDLKLRLGACDLVIGTSDDNAMWAVVLPNRPSKIKALAGGNGESIAHIWLRFHPAMVGSLFPEKEVKGPGDPTSLYWAYRIARAKVDGEFGQGPLLQVPPKDTVLIDMDTVDALRRVFTVDVEKEKVRYKSGYVTMAMPASVKASKKDAGEIIESAWQAFDESYAFFEDSPEMDWAAQLDDFKKRATYCKTVYDSAILLHQMLDGLQDSDIYVGLSDEIVRNGFLELEYNARWDAIRSTLGTVNTEESIAWSLTPQKVGYIAILGAIDDADVDTFDKALESMDYSWSLILDLRYLNKGELEFAEKMAGRFLAQDSLYGYLQEREEGGTGLREKVGLTCKSRGEWQYSAPIYLILGGGTAAVGEQFCLMAKQAPKCTTMGSPTGGFSLNRRRVDLPGGVWMTIPVGRDLDLDGNSWKGKGLQPDAIVEFPDEEFDSTSDPVLYRVLEDVLKTPWEDRIAGREGAVAPEAKEGE